jgi:hypothetical protein
MARARPYRWSTGWICLRTAAFIETNPSWPDRQFIDEGLGVYNAPFLRDPRYDHFGVFLRAGNAAIRAALIGSLYSDWLFIPLLWVDADLRRRRPRRQRADRRGREARARLRLPFRLGRHVFVPGVRILPETRQPGIRPLDGNPPGHCRTFLKKQLAAEV